MARTGRPPVEMTGRRFGRLVVLRRDLNLGHVAAWLCACDCGVMTTVAGTQLRKANGTRSCGCFNRGRPPRHGMTGSRTWNSWRAMSVRCSDPRHPAWSRYGGRGIRVCAAWQGPGGFDRFLADMGTRPAGMTLDRIDNDGNYEPGNCRWATAKQQRANQSR